MSLLTAILLSPLLAAIAVAVTPRTYRFGIRLLALAGTAVSFLLSVVLFWKFLPGVPGYQFVQKIPWVGSLGISYHVGVDGVNVGLILMGALVAFAATCLSTEIKERQKEFYLLLLVMITGILGAFASLDLFFFFFFHELALIPTFIMIGVWGRGADKNYAAFNITLYLTAGAMLALAGLIGLQIQSGARTFDIAEMTAYVAQNPISLRSQQWIFPLLLFGFGILVSLWPFHTWAPLGYGAAPTPTAMLHAGVLKKFGLYGLIRLALPLLPEASHSWRYIIAVLCLGNILYCGLVAMRQRNLGLLIGNSSVAHMGFVFLGIASLSLAGVTGAVVVMVAHGLLAALTFGIAGHLQQQAGHLEMDRFGGLLRPMPFIGSLLIMAALAGCGLPGFANFAGEVMVLFGSWNHFPLVTALAVWGALVIGAVYMLRAVRDIAHGPVPEPDGPDPGSMQDAATPWRRLPFCLLLGALLLFGFFPSLLTEKIKPAAREILTMQLRPKSAPPARPTASIAP